MAAEVNVQSKVDVDPNFERQLRRLKDEAAVRAVALQAGGQVLNMRPLGWPGHVDDYGSIHDALNRDVANQQFIDAVKDATKPGTSGDLIAATLMVDYLGSMERAYKNRVTMSRARRVAHAAGRTAGQGSDTGVFVQGVIEYLRRIIQHSKGPQ